VPERAVLAGEVHAAFGPQRVGGGLAPRQVRASGYRELQGSHTFTGLTNGTEYDLGVTVVRDGGAELSDGWA